MLCFQLKKQEILEEIRTSCHIDKEVEYNDITRQNKVQGHGVSGIVFD